MKASAVVVYASVFASIASPRDHEKAENREEEGKMKSAICNKLSRFSTRPPEISFRRLVKRNS